MYDIQVEPDKYHPVWVDDINVRVATDVITLDSDDEVVQKYLLYNGPVKPRLLGYIQEPAGVAQRWDEQGSRVSGAGDVLRRSRPEHDDGLSVARHDGPLCRPIYWTWLLIHTTNLMHWVLSKLLWIIPSYGLAIMFLTMMVRGLMFPVSRKRR